MFNFLFAVFNRKIIMKYPITIEDIEKINDEVERCLNLFPQKDYLYRSYSSEGFDKDGKIYF